MIILNPVPPIMSAADPDLIFDRLEKLFMCDWHARIDEVGGLIASLRDEDNLLRWFIAGVANRLDWPTLTGAQSFTLRSSETMLARINLWFPVASMASEAYRRYLSIDEIHNHDFDFFTTCLLGDGYDSTFWHDPDFRSDRRVGDRIELHSKQELRLADRDIWFINASTDYHAQHWPKSFAVTLNVLPNWQARPTTIQYVLDGSHNIKTVIDSGLPSVGMAA